MANLKDIRKRIVSVKNTQQITSAMKMVAAAKFRRAQESIEKFRPYAEKMDDVLKSLALRTNYLAHPLLQRRPVSKVLIVVVTSDRGLCGGFNQNIIRFTDRFLRENHRKYSEIALALIGRKGYEYFRKRNVSRFKSHTGISGKISYELANRITGEFSEAFLTQTYDEVYLLYNKFVTAMTQQVYFERILPIEEIKLPEGEKAYEYVYEPSRDDLLDDIIVKNLDVQMLHALLESEASELGARMTAMDSATSNAQEMIERLTLTYNRARQESITKELLEIIGGAEAL